MTGVPNVLVAGEEAERVRIASALDAKQMAVVAVDSPAAALDVLRRGAVDFAVFSTSGREDLDAPATLQAVRRLRPMLKTLFIVEPG